MLMSVLLNAVLSFIITFFHNSVFFMQVRADTCAYIQHIKSVSPDCHCVSVSAVILLYISFFPAVSRGSLQM